MIRVVPKMWPASWYVVGAVGSIQGTGGGGGSVREWPMREPVCTPGQHVGDDVEGRCSACNERLRRADLLPLGLSMIALSAVIALAILALVLWWAFS
jgi:disulfide bond formation protein DsbB